MSAPIPGPHRRDSQHCRRGLRPVVPSPRQAGPSCPLGGHLTEGERGWGRKTWLWESQTSPTLCPLPDPQEDPCGEGGGMLSASRSSDFAKIRGGQQAMGEQAEGASRLRGQARPAELSLALRFQL